MIINENNIMLKLCYPELWVKESLQNRPVIWFVAKREDYNGMMQNNDWGHYKEDGTLPLSSEYWLWDDPVYCYNDDPSYVKPDNTIHTGTKKPYEMFVNESDLAYHKQRTRYYIARYGYSTKIYAFEILSEPWHLGEGWASGQSNQAGGAPFLAPTHPDHDSTRYAIYNYHKVISEYIKDSLHHNKQLIGMNMGDELSSSDGGLDKSVILPSIDFVGFNPYYLAPNALIKSNTNYMKKYIDRINNNREFDQDSIIGYYVVFGDSVPIYNPTGNASVPIIISEGGTDASYLPCSNFDLDIVDKMTLPFTGVAGINTWLGYRPNFLKDENDVVTMPNSTYDMWDNTIRVKNHMNGNDVINTLSDTWGAWKHGMEKSKLFIVTVHDNVDAIEQQYYLSNSRNKVVGYVRNRTYNIHTKRVNSDCDLNYGDIEPIDDLENIKWNDNRLPLNRRLDLVGLNASEEYTIDYYSFRTGNHISTQCEETNNDGELRLKYPDLNTSVNPLNPVIWYVAYQQNCNSGMAQQNNTEESEEELERTQVLNNNKNVDQDLNLYPNPFNNFISIQNPQKDQLILKSIEGKVIDVFEIKKDQSSLNTTVLSGGIYILTFKSQNKTFKLIKR